MSRINDCLPSEEKELASTRREFVELYGVPLITNSYLRIAALCLSVVCLGLLALEFRTYQAFHNLKPLVIRINDVGRAEAVAYDSLTYQPRDAEVRYFLMEFIAEHYSRIRATVREDFARSLYFLDGRLADATIEAGSKSKTIEMFLAGGGPEIDVVVNNVSIEDMRRPPYKATVDFERVYFNYGDRTELKREKYTAHIVFVVRDHVPNAMIPVNPLGLTITYFREDQAFHRGIVMVTNVFFATTILFIALGFFLLDECPFLIPYKSLLIHEYGTRIAFFAALLFVNIFAAIYFAVRKLLLKETGRKLAHVEKQLRTGQSISGELTERLKEHLL